MNTLGFQLLTYLVQLGTMYALACVWKCHVSREESHALGWTGVGEFKGEQGHGGP